jgi:hypothetical protein
MSVVIFAGAGCSVGAPASLPGWFDLNDAILDALWDRMAPYNLPDWTRGDVLSHIKAKRKQYAFPPDYQAQVMVERVGMKYFELLTAVDSDVYNAIHHYTAEGARAGLVKALVTTNFDRNFERAFAEARVSFRTFIDESDFNTFERRPPGGIPIVKIHGSCSSPNFPYTLRGSPPPVPTYMNPLIAESPQIEIAVDEKVRRRIIEPFNS